MSGRKQKDLHVLEGMRGRRKGGRRVGADEGFDRSHSFTLTSLSDEWLEYLGSRNYSKRSLQAYHDSFKMFLGWAHERSLVDATSVVRPTLESYQAWLYRYKKANGDGLSVDTQRWRLGALQRFFSYLCKKGYLQANPASDLDLPRKPHRSLPKGLSREELRQLFALPDITDTFGLRDRAILELLYATGIRRVELAKLDLTDIDLDESTVHIRDGKGGKSRLLPLGNGARTWLERYLTKSRPQLSMRVGEPALFLSGYGERFNPNYLGNWIRKQMSKLGIEKKGACHLFRHSCATHMLENGADIRVIQKMLGHERLDTTQIYTEVSIQHLREVHENTHPSAQS